MSPRYLAALAAAIALHLLDFSSSPAAEKATTPPGAPALPSAPRQLHYLGFIEYQGHGPRPGDSRRYVSDQWYYADGKGRIRLDWMTWEPTDSARVPESILVVGDAVFHRGDPSSPWKRRAGYHELIERFQAEAGFRTASYGELRAHPRLGDVRDSVIFDDVLMRQVVHERDAQWSVSERLVGSSVVPPPDSLFASPATSEPPDSSDYPLTAEPVIVQLAPGIYCADMNDIDSRCLIAEFADHLLVAEIAVGSRNGERIVDALKRRWPAKPIRYASFSHHHPHYLGGLRAVMAEGATVITTPGNEALVREIAARPFTIEPDRFARAPKPVSVRTFTGRTELADSTNQLVLLDYGARSHHTDEFVVFYFPRQKFLFESELGWVNQDDGTIRASSRAKGLLDWIAQQKLDVERLAQGWPMRGNEREVTRAWLEEAVAKRNK